MVSSLPSGSAVAVTESERTTDIQSLPGDISCERALVDWIVSQAYEEERERRRRQPLPRWVRLSMRAMPKVLAIATITNGLIGLLAIVTPWLRTLLGDSATASIYTAYSFICPQRPSHTWFIGGVPMAMEQRMVAMYVAFGAAGIAYLLWKRIRRPLLTWAALLAIAPALIDVGISTVELRPSTDISRLWTGTLGSLGIVFWAYPRFETQLSQVRRHLYPMEACQASQESTMQDAG